MSLTFIRSAAGAALLAVLAAGCGTAVTAQHAGAKPTAAAQPHHSAAAHAPVTMPTSPPATSAPATSAPATSAPATTAPAPVTTAPASPANPIPQGNGGDHDPDNNGGPSDGDGNL
jgi:hypothetical protein